jgi:hypothetical protein
MTAMEAAAAMMALNGRFRIFFQFGRKQTGIRINYLGCRK